MPRGPPDDVKLDTSEVPLNWLRREIHFELPYEFPVATLKKLFSARSYSVFLEQWYATLKDGTIIVFERTRTSGVMLDGSAIFLPQPNSSQISLAAEFFSPSLGPFSIGPASIATAELQDVLSTDRSYDLCGPKLHTLLPSTDGVFGHALAVRLLHQDSYGLFIIFKLNVCTLPLQKL